MNKPTPKTEAVMRRYPKTRVLNLQYVSFDAANAWASAAAEYGQTMIVTSQQVVQLVVNECYDFEEVAEYLEVNKGGVSNGPVKE